MTASPAGPADCAHASRLACACDGSRRGFLSALAGLGAAAVLPGCATPLAGPGVAGSRYRIDTHHHLFSPAYAAELEKARLSNPAVRNWSVAKTLDDMEKGGVATAMLSVTQPGVTFVNAEAARRVARESNEWVAKLAQDHPGRFGSFALVPMQDTGSALREIEYALDVLKADGICLMTSYGTKWLGHSSFVPVLDEINRRKAVLYAHPNTADCCRNLQPEIPVGPGAIEWGTDTTRTIVDIVFSGTAARCPDIKYIFSHAGGTMPFLVERLLKMPELDPRLKPRVPNGVMHELKRFHYDTAWALHPGALAALTRLVDVPQILFGSDYPYRTGEDTVKGIVDYGFSPADLRAIGRDNALRLMPKWRA